MDTAASQAIQLTDANPIASSGFNLSLLKFSTVAQVMAGLAITITVVATTVIATTVFVLTAKYDYPIARPDTGVTWKKTPVPLYVLANDEDPRQAPLTVTAVTTPTYGSVKIGSGGKFVIYTPNPGYAGIDTFNYTAMNDKLSSSAKVTVTVKNHDPLVFTQKYQLQKNSINNKLEVFKYQHPDTKITISDDDDDELFVVRCDQPMNGQVNTDEKNVYYTPFTYFNGLDSTNCTITDKNSTVSFGIELSIVNSPPIANPDVISVAKNTFVSVDVLSNDFDINRDELNVTWTGNVGQGSARISADKKFVEYIPSFSTASTTDSFEYVCTDGFFDSSSYVVINLVNNPPQAKDLTKTVSKNTKDNILTLVQCDSTKPGASFDYCDTDVAESLSVSIKTQAAVSGSFELITSEPELVPVIYGNGEKFINIATSKYSIKYTPKSGETGQDILYYTVTDSGKLTATGKITINIVNTAPVAPTVTLSCSKRNSITANVMGSAYDPDGDQIVLSGIEAIAGVTKGTVTKVGTNQATYTAPANGFTGTDTFRYIVSDVQTTQSDVLSTAGTVQVNVFNEAPVPFDDSGITVQKGITFNIDVLANDVDPNRDAISINSKSETNQKANTTIVKVTKNGQQVDHIAYTSLNSVYNDTFTYDIKDEDNLVSTKTAKVSLSVVNTPPVANDDTATLFWNSTVSIAVLANDVDVNPGDKEILRISSVSASVKGGSVDNQGTSIVYTPRSGFVGVDTFTYKVKDQYDESASATVTVTVINNAPVAVNDAYTKHHLVSTIDMDVLANDRDPQNDPIALVSVSGTSKAQLVQSGGKTIIRYTSAPSVGTETFTYTITDYEKTATGTVTVTSTDVAPVANPDTLTIKWRNTAPQTINVLANDSDQDGDTISISGPPTLPQGFRGTLVQSGNSLVFTGPGNWAGTQQATYKITDGTLEATGTVTIVLENSEVPTAPAVSFSSHWRTQLTAGTIVPLLTKLTDNDQDTLTLTVASVPTGATAQVNPDGMSITYKHANGFTGTETFTYTVSDGLASATGSISATVYNNAPVAPAVSATVAPNKRVSGILIDVLRGATDADAEDFAFLTLDSFTTTDKATITLDAATNQIKYVPKATNYAFVDTFNYVIYDGLARTTGSVTVSVQYSAGASTDVFKDVLWNVQKNSPAGLVFSVAGAGNTLNSVTTQATKGTCTIIAGTQTIRYAQQLDYLGADSCVIGYTIDATGATGSITVFLNVYDNAPTANSLSFSNHWKTLEAGVNYNILNGVADADAGDVVTLSAKTNGAKGTVTLNTPSAGFVLYRATAKFLGTDSFTYTATDGLLTVTRPVTITSTNANKPSASPITKTVHWRELATNGLSFAVLSSATDGDNDSLSFTVGTGSRGGVLTINGQSVTYTHASWTGTETFSYTVTDGIESSTSTITVSVTNTAPVANNDVYSFHWKDARAGRNLVVKANDTDANSDPISIIRVGVPSLGGTATKQSDDSILYTAAASKIGTETFTYAISDTIAESTATVTVTLTNAAPVANNIVATTKWNAALSGVTLACSDADLDQLTTAFKVQPKFGTLSSGTYTPDASKLAYTLTPDTDGKYKLVDSFSFTCSDTVATAEGSIQITVYNTPPVARVDEYTFQRNVALTTPRLLHVLNNDTDADGDSITLSTYSASNGATLSASNGVISYTPVSNYVGTEKITYTITDGNLQTTGFAFVTMLNTAPSCNSFTKTGLLKGTKYRWYLASEAACTDVNNDVLTFAVPATNTYTKGVVATGSDSTGFYVEYTPNNLRSQDDSITFTVTDGFVTLTRTITIGILNRSPTQTSFQTTLIARSADTVLPAWNVLSGVTDPDAGDTVSLATVSQGNCTSAGTLAIVSNTIQFTQKGGYGPGSCSFSFTYKDNDVDAPITVTVTGSISVSGATAPPVAVDDAFTFNQGQDVLIAIADLLKNDYDVDNDQIVFDGVVCRLNYTCTKAYSISADGLYISIPSNLDDLCGTIYYEYRIRTPVDGQTSIAKIAVTYSNCKCVGADICFVVDGTSTVTSTQWAATKALIKNLVYLIINNPASLLNTAADKVSICFIQYAQTAERSGSRGFTLTQSEGAIYKNVDAISQYSLSTRYGIAGLNLAKTELLTSRNTRKKMVYISYGVPNYPCSCSNCASVYGSDTSQCSIPSTYPSLTCNNCTWDISNYPNSVQNPQKWCAPCADPTTVANNINSVQNWRVITIGGGGAVPQLGLNQLSASAYNPQSYFNIPNLDPNVIDSATKAKIIDAICGTTNRGF